MTKCSMNIKNWQKGQSGRGGSLDKSYENCSKSQNGTKLLLSD